MKSSPIVRMGVAAGLYLMLMWGYLVLPSGQWFAAFLALIMSATLFFWVSEVSADLQENRASAERKNTEDLVCQSSGRSTESDLDAAVLRLDSLKEELAGQYAQFGKDQALLNCKGLGSWHSTRMPRGR